ncbi:hypothetical protein [uncultured Microbulbifer sp.]|uniref:hypothetical protein n=1 Tax=uncultured Microbulbifer sp. TaxID=348147 RepID=UPI00261A68EB|nr:hypothetical protein [uncultured Microbulbifer sp.]
MSKVIELSTRLLRNPYPKQPKPCVAQILPLEGESDFLAISQLPVGKTPVLLSFSEHYQLLVELLECVDSAGLEIDTILLRMQMPAGGRMPKQFLQDRVLMLQGVHEEELILHQQGTSYLVIEDTLIRHPLESGSNSLRLRIRCVADCNYLISRISEKLLQLGFDSIEKMVRERTA